LIKLPLVTQRLLLRPLVPADAEELHETLSHPTTLAAIGRKPPWTIDDTHDSIDRRMREQRALGISMWAVVERASGRVVGICGLQPVGHEGPDVEIGWHMHPDLRGLGYATEAGRAVLAAGLRDHGLDRIVALTHERNRGSRRVMEKIGLEYEGPTDYYGPGTVIYSTGGSGSRGTGITAPSAENASGSREPGSTTTPSSGSPTQQA
jgi:ribosomal-protein-alanine N-acetyltransferase